MKQHKGSRHPFLDDRSKAAVTNLSFFTMVSVEEFPSHWGSPPAIMTADYVGLPGGYGHGSSSLKSWIATNMANDRENGKVSYPKSWGEPPMMQTRDLRPLPLGYGSGSGTLAKWIKEKAEASGTYHEET